MNMCAYEMSNWRPQSRTVMYEQTRHENPSATKIREYLLMLARIVEASYKALRTRLGRRMHLIQGADDFAKND